jgi:hypothetical protein
MHVSDQEPINRPEVQVQLAERLLQRRLGLLQRPTRINQRDRITVDDRVHVHSMESVVW